jgi:hypothetical protein
MPVENNRYATIIFRSRIVEVEPFRRFAEQAAALGATHVNVDSLPYNRWRWERDCRDPYPNWSIIRFSLFDASVPEPLAPWFPAEHAERSLEIIAHKGEILRELGLKGSIWGCEPMWLPEDVYLAHPEWRGPRCEHPLRARKPYYAPCIDHPEVLAMYRESVARICGLAPVDRFTFLTNDSGGGICWSEGLYPGRNGPAHCEHRPLAERMSGWMSAVQAGAAEAGLEAQVQLIGTIPQAEVSYVGRQLMKGQGVGGAGTAIAGSTNYLYGSFLYPVRELPQTADFAEHLERAYKSKAQTLLVNFPSEASVELMEIYRLFRESPTDGMYARTGLLKAAADAVAAPGCGEKLLELWEHIRRTVEAVKPMENGGPVLLLGVTAQRWLTRPLVPYPMELPEETKAYYRSFQFQARTEEHAADLMDCQAAKLIQGKHGTWLAGKLLDTALGHVSQAIRVTESLGTVSGELLLRLQVLRCLLRTVRHTSRYQDLLERAAISTTEREVDRGGTARVLPVEMQVVVRAETDNVQELIRLLEQAATPPIITAGCPEEESVFELAPVPELIGQLKTKTAIMLKHEPDHKRLLAAAETGRNGGAGG